MSFTLWKEQTKLSKLLNLNETKAKAEFGEIHYIVQDMRVHIVDKTLFFDKFQLF